jgi:hypothetical protein
VNYCKRHASERLALCEQCRICVGLWPHRATLSWVDLQKGAKPLANHWSTIGRNRRNWPSFNHLPPDAHRCIRFSYKCLQFVLAADAALIIIQDEGAFAAEQFEVSEASAAPQRANQRRLERANPALGATAQKLPCQHTILIARPLHCRCPTPRDFVPWCISDAGLHGAEMGSSLPASEMLHNCCHLSDGQIRLRQNSPVTDHAAGPD